MAMREWLDSTAGRIVAVALLAVAAAAVFIAVRRFMGDAPEVAEANTRVFIDQSTGQSFSHTLKAGDAIPIRTPSGKEAGYPAELCYWTKDGQQKTEPTAVLLKSWLGQEGQTFCPDCGRLVRPHNPKPMPGDKPPPTEAEYKQRRGGANDQNER